MRYIFNSAVLGRPGRYDYKLVTELEAEAWLKHSHFSSRVGSEATAQFLKDRFGVRCPLSREPIVMQPGDEALVVRLKYRLPDLGAKAHLAPRNEDWELGLLERVG